MMCLACPRRPLFTLVLGPGVGFTRVDFDLVKSCSLAKRRSANTTFEGGLMEG